MNTIDRRLAAANYAPVKTASVKKESASADEKIQQAEGTVREDKFVSAPKQDAVTYTKPKKPTADELMAMERQRMDSFQQMLRGMITKQGQKSNLTLFGMDLTVTAADRNAAAAAIAPGGEYSVDAVAGRILDMAKALSGGDPSKIEELRTAVQKGFKAAGVDLGGKLPSICHDTFNKVMEGFDEWKNSFETAE